MNRFLTGLDRIVATSPNYAQSSRVLRRFAHKTEIIPLGLGPRPPVLVERRAHWRRRVRERFFLFVGAARYYKGIPFLLAAARLTGLPVVMAGVAPADLAEYDVPPNVVALGTVCDDDKEALLDLCLGFVLPSHLRSEAFGISLLEAARAGKPMISCEIGTGTSFINRDSITGRVIPPDPEALAAAMREMAEPAEAPSTTLFPNIGIEGVFTLDQKATSYLELCRNVL